MFCTFFLGVLDLKTGHMIYSNAGHEAPYIIASGVERLPVDSNMALGVMEGMSFTAQEIQLPADALLFLYTDGLTEATNQDGVLFGKVRVEDALKRILDEDMKDAAGYVGKMAEEVAAFVKEAPQADDLTMLAIRKY
jgi:sigma-B regulation protein RsbU (phosphoserine phosphatase)